MANLDDAVVTHVYYKMGNLKNDNRGRFLRAPFSVLKMDGDVMLVTEGFCDDPALALKDLLVNNSATGNTEQAWRRRLGDNGWCEGFEFIEFHQMGNGQNDDWRSLHAFGLL